MANYRDCPFCGNNNLERYRFNVGGFLEKNVAWKQNVETGMFFRIECRCGCKFDKCQDELYDKAVKIYTCDGKYDVEITDEDLWAVMAAEWNRRVRL